LIIPTDCTRVEDACARRHARRSPAAAPHGSGATSPECWSPTGGKPVEHLAPAQRSTALRSIPAMPIARCPEPPPGGPRQV
jgi:hypothetical protein